MNFSLGYRGISALALTLAAICVGLIAAPAAIAAFPYTLNSELSLTGDCSTSAADPVHDPDCAGDPPAYPPLPNRPSGRFSRPFSVAVDDWGNLYVASRSPAGTEGRIDIFDNEGHFISELADPNGPWSIAVDGEGNLYAYEDAEKGAPAVVRYPPVKYNPAAGEIEYDEGARITISSQSVFSGLAIDRANPADAEDDRLLMARNNRIEVYSSAKAGNTLLVTIEPAGLSAARFAAVDAKRRLLYVTTCKEVLSKCVVWVLSADAPYTFIKEINGSTTPAGAFFSNQGRISIAVDETNGHFFAGDLGSRDDIYEFDEDHAYLSTFEIPGGALVAEVQSDVAENPKDPDPANLNKNDNYRHLFVPLSHTAGSALAFEPPEVEKPKIESAAAVNIGTSEAELEALVHPHQAETTYEIKYVTQAQFEINGFASATSAATGTIPGVNSPQRVSTILSGLAPGTTYRFLVTAENEVDEADPKEGAFTTYSDPPISNECTNQTLRTGPSAALPDCRAWELVTPPDTNGKAPTGAGFEGDRFGMVQASPSGGAVSFEVVNGTLPGTEGSGYFYGDPYLATRGESGWSSALAGPTGAQASKPKPGSFSPDQGYSFWLAEGEGSALVGGKATGYIRYPDGHSELIGRGSLGTDPRALGELITENATHVVFQTHTFLGTVPVKLEPNAPATGIPAVYDRTRDPVTGAEETHVVSLLPGEVTPNQPATYVGASADGEGIAFKIGTTLYLRVDNKATHQIGTPGATFAGIADGGERAFYLEGGDLEAFDTSTGVITFADTADTVVPVNVSPDGTRAYFVSETVIVGSGTNPEGDSAQLGEQNLYLSEEGTITFVATVTERDVEGASPGTIFDGLGLWTLAQKEQKPPIDPSRLTPDGGVLVFQSRANLTGYQPGEDAQIYRYDHTADRLHCLSCPPTETAATGGAALQSYYSFEDVPTFSYYGFVPALRSDGARVFFESTEALVSTDTDDKRDVYEWEEEKVGSCKRPGGCVYLISSGGSAREDYLFGHSASGDDVFVQTADVLVAGDAETISIYDARVGGGFAGEVAEPCREEACHPAATPPPVLPQAGLPKKSGNLKQCPRGKRKVIRRGREVCIKKKKKNRHHKTAKRRAHR